MRMWTEIKWIGTRPVADPREDGNEILGFIKGGEFHRLSDYKLIKKPGAPWSWCVCECECVVIDI